MCRTAAGAISQRRTRMRCSRWRRIVLRGSRGRRRSALRAARRPGAARRRVLPGRRGRQGRPGRRQRRGQDHAAAHRHRRPEAARRRRHPHRRARGDAADGRARPADGRRRGAHGRRPAALGLAPAGAQRHRRGRPLRADADGDRRREDAAALRRGAVRVRRRGRLRPRGHLGRVHRSRRSACPSTGRSTASCAPCPAASRSGWCWSSCWPGPTRCCCSTSPTTSSTCPARSGSSSGSGSPTRPSCSSATTASCSTTPRPGS